jgi:hypothetical protein
MEVMMAVLSGTLLHTLSLLPGISSSARKGGNYYEGFRPTQKKYRPSPRNCMTRDPVCFSYRVRYYGIPTYGMPTGYIQYTTGSWHETGMCELFERIPTHSSSNQDPSSGVVVGLCCLRRVNLSRYSKKELTEIFNSINYIPFSL